MHKPQRDVDLSRRSVLVGTAGVSVMALAGCLEDPSNPDPISLAEGDYCDQCGMDIVMHPGPKGQAFYDDDDAAELLDNDRDAPAKFCSTVCLYEFLLSAAAFGYDLTVAYATDYSHLDYDLVEENGETVITAHLESNAFSNTTELSFVAGSDVEGAMGGSVIGFLHAADAADFAETHGGDIIGHEEVTNEVLSSL